MNAMILAAGRGERMRPLTDTTPKPLLQVRGKALIEYHLEKLAAAGIKRVVINVSWLAQKIRRALGDGERFGVDIHYSFEAQALETAGGIVQALPLLEEAFIVVNGDIFTDFDFCKLDEPAAQAHLVMVPNPRHNAAGDFAIDKGMLVNGQQDRLTFAGIASYRRSFFSGLEPGRRALAPLFHDGAEKGLISAEMHPGQWSDVGTPERLQSIDRDA